MRAAILIAVVFLPLAAHGAANGPGSLALLLNETNGNGLDQQVRDALRSPDRLMRATAARIAGVRNLVSTLPALRDGVATEKDIDVAAEMVAAAVLLGESDLQAMLLVSDRFQSKLDRVISGAVVRARPSRAVEEYIAWFRTRKVVPEYFMIATWGHPERLVASSARLLGVGDERGWSMILDVARESAVAAPATVLGASLTSRSAAIRSDTIWYLVHGYHPDPSKIPPSLRAIVTQTDKLEGMNVDEEFGREVIRRMFGERAREEGRWVEWLRSGEETHKRVDTTLDTLLTDRERKARWEKPTPRVIKGSIQSKELARPAYILPSLLPAGLAADVVRATRCQGGWLGLARTTVDLSGRVQNVDLGSVTGDEPCLTALRTLIRLSLATNTSLLSPLTVDQLVVKGRTTPPCLDAASVADSEDGVVLRVAGSVKPPAVIERVEPVFPADAKQAMPQGSNVIIIAESEISRTGCVRRIRLVKQSPFGSLNAAAVLALSQWKFKPATIDGTPVDVVFNLSIDFKVP